MVTGKRRRLVSDARTLRFIRAGFWEVVKRVVDAADEAGVGEGVGDDI
jgi:hypothetical protein